MFTRAVALAALLSSNLCALDHALAYQEPGDERVDYTAYTLRAGEFSVGILSAQVGVTDFALVGTYVPPWFAFPVLDSTIPSAFVKVRDPFGQRLAASVRATVVYVDASALANELSDTSGVDASLVVFPVELATSYRWTQEFSQSLLFTYVAARMTGKQTGETSFRGAAALSNLTLSTLLEVRLTRVFALTLLGRALVYQQRAHVTAEFTQGTTQVEADLGSKAKDYRCIVPGVAFSWSHVNLELGLGYGSWWLPVVELPLPSRGLVPEFDFYVRF